LASPTSNNRGPCCLIPSRAELWPPKPKHPGALFLAAGSAAAVFATVKIAAAGTMDTSEAQLLALEAEIMGLNEAARAILEERVEPFEDE
jgi:hypothetical protein